MKKLRSSAAPAAAPKARGRPRSFDRETALDAAMRVFWTKGYEAASISELTEAMGINPPSLYAAFGDKEKLFLACMEKYAASHGEGCPGFPTAREAIDHYLHYKVDLLSGAGDPRGCMLMVAFFTAANASATLQKFIAGKAAMARDQLRTRIKQGIQDGDVPPDTDAGALADFYGAVIAGVAQQARDGMPRRSMLATVERAMQAFPPVPRVKRRLLA